MSAATNTLTPDQIQRLAHPQQFGRYRKLAYTVAAAPAVVNTTTGTISVYVGPELTNYRLATAEEVQAMLTAASQQEAA